jgi:signal transduction histidine kinase
MRVLRAVWDEPRVVAPPGSTWWDRALVAGLVPVAVLEGLLRPDVVWPWWHIGWAIVCVVTLLWRPHRPLAMLVVGYSAQTAAGVVPALRGEPYSVLDVTAVVLLLAYSLGRWASGRAVLGGTAFLLVVHLAREPLYDSSGSSIVIGVGALLFPVALGAALRFWARAQSREREEIRMRERERLARDLHDTVAHHVSGILLQARAARIKAASDPAGAVDAIRGVEDAASRSLDDMRALVAVLREDEPTAQREPTHGLADIASLADESVPRVTVTDSGDLDDVSAAVGAALFRAAQEAVTNARRHARAATRVDVELTREDDSVTLRVHDDGQRPAKGSPRGSAHYGLAGMRERFALLGGRVSAGPDPAGGWTVEVTAPALVTVVTDEGAVRG